MATRGLPASPGAASGQVVFSADHAVDWTQKGKQVILVRRETVPDDIHGMFVSQGILTATGGMTSHAAVVGRQMGKPSIVGAGGIEVDEHAREFRVDGQTVKEGDWISFDGLTGEVKLARVASKPSEILQVLNRQMKPQRVGHLPALRQAARRGRTSSAAWASARTPTCRIRPRSPTRSARAASGCAAPSTCSSARGASRSSSG